MHGLWNNFKSSVGETLDNIILSPKKLRKKFAEKKQNSTFSEKSNSFDKDAPEYSSNLKTNMDEGLSSSNVESSEKLISKMSTEINFEIETGKEETLERIQSIQNVQPDSCHNIGDSNKSEKALSRLTGSIDHRKGGDTVSTASVTAISVLKSKPAPPRRTNTLGVIDIELINDVGENESVEIDIADFESAKEEDKYLHNTRRQSISDRINRRRTSELAAEIIRLSAEHRRKEFSDLLDEHEEIVQNIEIWKKTGVLPPSRCTKSKSNLETVDDEEISDDIIDEEPLYFRQMNENSSSYHSHQDNKENKTLPRSH